MNYVIWGKPANVDGEKPYSKRVCEWGKWGKRILMTWSVGRNGSGEDIVERSCGVLIPLGDGVCVHAQGDGRI